MTSLLDCAAQEARTALLAAESYFTSKLPRYFVFDHLLASAMEKIAEKLSWESRSTYKKLQKATRCQGVNYPLIANKDGRYAWRQLELIHPVLYAALVALITQENHWQTLQAYFKEPGASRVFVRCESLPRLGRGREERRDAEEQILYWWDRVEQRSVSLALRYEVITRADIQDCYPRVYTHSIAWALHTKDRARQKRDPEALLGNGIDAVIRCMQEGQTNGIPQGSMVMDLVAEIVLHYLDVILNQKLEAEYRRRRIGDCEIIRYRDDYRIFSHSEADGEKVLRLLADSAREVGLSLNAQKTTMTRDVVGGSVKEDKVAWVVGRKEKWTLEEFVWVLWGHSKKYPNAGSLTRGFRVLREMIGVRADENALRRERADALVSMLVDIGRNSPRVWPSVAECLSLLLEGSGLKKRKKRELFLNVVEYFWRTANGGYMEVWLQRIAEGQGIKGVKWKEGLCRAVRDGGVRIWNSEWMSEGWRKCVEGSIVDVDILREVQPTIQPEEVELFVEGEYP